MKWYSRQSHIGRAKNNESDPEQGLTLQCGSSGSGASHSAACHGLARHLDYKSGAQQSLAPQPPLPQEPAPTAYTSFSQQ